MARRGGTGTIDVTEGVIWRQLLLLCLPIFFSSFFQQAHSIVNTYVVGHFASLEALGGIQATQAIVDLVVGFSIGVGTGSAIICGQQFGAGQDARLRTSVTTAMTFAAVGGVAMSALSLALIEPVLLAMGTPSELMPQALAFTRPYLSALAFSVVLNMGAAVMRSLGDTRTPALIVAACCVLNALLDVLFVMVWQMEAFGAGVATGLSIATGAVLTVWRLARADAPWRLDLRHLGIDRVTCRTMVLTGIPLGLQTSAYSISNIVIQTAVNSFGSTVVTAWGLSGRIDGVAWMCVEALAVAVTTFAAQNFGAHRYDRMRRGLHASFALAVLLVGSISGLILLFAPELAAFFVGHEAPEAPAVAAMTVHINFFIAPFYLLFSFMDNISGTIRGSGESVRPMAITMVGTCLLRILWIWLWIPTHRTLDMVLAVYPITYVVTTAAFVIYYRHGHWLRHGEEKRERALGA